MKTPKHKYGGVTAKEAIKAFGLLAKEAIITANQFDKASKELNKLIPSTKTPKINIDNFKN